MKDERTTLYKEIDALSTLVKPITGYDEKEAISYEIYEIHKINLSIGWDIPLRGFKIIEKTRIIEENKKIIGYDEKIFFCATTLPKWKASA